ncbi:MAG: pyruvate kinase [bacterium]|nr:pyruvate kinase [bacterium]
MLLATLSPYISFRKMVVSHPTIEALRFNTVTPTGGKDKEEILKDLVDLCGEKPLWIDLKSRQLRVTKWADPTFTTVELSHKISVNLPTTLYFKDHKSKIVDIVDGNKLILQNEPKRPVGAGEAVNILDPSLVIEGYLTESDYQYIEAAKKLGVHNYMLSFVEKTSDISEVVALDPDAKIVAKIESKRGIEFVVKEYGPFVNDVRLMAARDDLYINLGNQKEDIIAAEATIIQYDPFAYAASRILTSLESSEEVSLSDISDFHLLHLMGYSRFMLSDWICRDRYAFGEAISLIEHYESRSHHDRQSIQHLWS